MTAKHVLIVDDEPDICELIEITLGRMGLSTRSALTLADAHRHIDSESFDLCLTDMRLPDGDGIELVEYLQRKHPDLPIAVITAHGNMELAVKALKAGAFDFVSKPVDIRILRNLVSAATALPRGDRPEDSGAASINQTTITGSSIAVKAMLDKIGKLARSQAPVFIHGESGSGKERVARMIHEQGSRSAAAFVPVNCGAIPAELMESEFFGHIKGSFTGAACDKDGLFQAAHGGTLFLDEIAELPLNMQVKLLRAIQEKAVRPVGSQQEVPVDVRILSASNHNLEQLVAEGRFRQDLYYRIDVIDLAVPALRERSEDIPQLAAQLLQTLAEKAGISPVPGITRDAIAALKDYPFPGNVRELENILERALALAENNLIQRRDLALGKIIRPTALRQPQGVEEPANALNLAGQEKNAILKALDKTRWNKTAAAKMLGLSLRQLRYRLQKLGIE